MLSNREKTVLIVQSNLIIGSHENQDTKHSMMIARRLQNLLEIDMSLDEFTKICKDVDSYNNVEVSEISFQVSNR